MVKNFSIGLVGNRSDIDLVEINAAAGMKQAPLLVAAAKILLNRATPSSAELVDRVVDRPTLGDLAGVPVGKLNGENAGSRKHIAEVVSRSVVVNRVHLSWRRALVA